MTLASSALSVRLAIASDADALLCLMRELAVFEGYITHFCITTDDLLERGLGAKSAGERQEFVAFVAATNDGCLLGHAVVYRVPFTYDLRENLVLKELYVSADARGMGVGHKLMSAVLAFAKEHACARLKWEVLPGNAKAQAFYRSLGGAPDTSWENWILHME